MIVYLDGMWFRSTGIGRIYENLLTGLMETDEVEIVHTIVSLRRKQEFLDRFQSAKVRPVFKDYPLDFREMLRKGFELNNIRPKPDVFYFPSFNVPFFLKGRVVSTICDLIPLTPYFDLPWHMRARFRQAIRHALKRSIRVVCISRATRTHVMKEFGIDGNQLEVIYPPLDVFPYRGSIPAEKESNLVEGDYLLYVGNRNPHKNLKCLLDAYRILLPRYPELKVVIAGPRMRKNDDVDAAKGLPEMRRGIVEITAASDQEIQSLYRSARVFVFPTLIEGFGIPPLEALSHSIPVVCSDIPVIREVCGEYVRFAEPNNPDDFAKAIDSLLQNRGDSTNRSSIERCCGRYSIEAVTRQYLDLFKRCTTEQA